MTPPCVVPTFRPYTVENLEFGGFYASSCESRAKLFPPTEVLYASVASGEVEIGFNQISEILAQPTVELAGPLPSAIQNYTQFAPGIVTGSSQADAARALVTFLSSPAARVVLTAKGFE